MPDFDSSAALGVIKKLNFDIPVIIVSASIGEDIAVNALLYLDLDQFKAVNDTCGHSAGDQLRKQSSALLLTNVRVSIYLP